MIIQSKRVYIASLFIPAQIEIEDGKIIAINKYNEKSVDEDYGNKRIVPGFYDIHTHGYKGFDTTKGGKDGLRTWLKDLPKEGVCGVCPTTLTNGYDTLINALKEVKEVYDEKQNGAKILGVHFEGPYLDVKYKGAQPEKYIVKPSIDEFKKYQEASGNLIKIITLAPEHDDNFELTKYCFKNNINVSIGHSDADYDTALLAIANGAQGFTHTYNAMSAFTHRSNGVVGASLRCRDHYSEIICDGNHSTLTALNIFYKEKEDHAIMVSDSLMCKGYPVCSKFDFGGQEVEIYPDGSAHLTSGNKSLAGSTLKMNDGLRILVEEALVPFDLALNSMTINPMKYLRMDDHKGRIKVTYDADIVVLNDDYSIEQTYCKGIKQL